MKVLLINPSVNAAKFGRFFRLLEPMPPLGLASMAGTLAANGIAVEVLDDFVWRRGRAGVAEAVKRFRPDIVGFSVLTPSYYIALEMAREVKNLDNNALVVFGNVHPSVFPEESLGSGVIDVVVHGEGEYTLLDLCRVKAGELKLGEVAGISYRDRDQAVTTARREPIANLDALPLPDWSGFPYRKYGLLSFANVRRPVLTMRASRGCPYDCSYCCLNYIEKKYRARSPASVAAEMEYLESQYGVAMVGFCDPTFGVSKPAALALCDELIRRGLNRRVVWMAETRVDLMDEELLARFYEAGCRRLMFGIETAAPELMDNINKPYDTKKAASVIRLARKHGIQTVGLFMLGLPGETREATLKTMAYSRKLNLDFAKYAITVPFPGSRLYEAEKTRLRTTNWEDFSTFNPEPADLPYVPEGRDPADLIRLQRRAHRDFYLRPQIIFRQLIQIRTISLKEILVGLSGVLKPDFRARFRRGRHA